MKRWKNGIDEMIENKAIDDFLDDIVAICVKHNLTISHEDHGGAFVVEKFNSNNIKWIKDAFDNT